MEQLQPRILHLEDSKFGAGLIRENLKAEWPDCSIELVDNEADFCQALDRGEIDIILADYSLPGFDGLTALDIAKQHQPGIPFIFLSGTMGEIIAIEAIKKGATDYVLKSGIFRLIPAIKRALQEHAEHVERLKLEEIVGKLRLAIEQAPLSIVMTDSRGVIEYVNPRLAEMSGYAVEELLGRTPGVFKSPQTPPETHQELWQTVTSGAVWKGELCNRKKNGELFYEATTISPVQDTNGVITNYIGIKEDITEKKELEAQLRQAQKMDVLGQLAGGVAHDFNNILQVIMGYSYVLKMENALAAAQREKLEQIIGAAEKAAQLTKGLLALMRKQVLTPKNVNLNFIVHNLRNFLARVIGEDIKLNILICDIDLPVHADSCQIEQTLINLASNARDAMPHGGMLTIETGLQEIDTAFAKVHGYGEAGLYAVITVSDTGHGISEETQKRIFEPFFTTKETGKGTGLGMAIVYGIIKQHNGFINLYSEPGKGTTFRIYLPLKKTAAVSAVEQPAPAPPARGSETILVAEDDAGVRQLLASILTEYGYEVLLAVDGKDVVRQLMANRSRIRLILMDMIMPKQGGQAAAEEIRKLQPEVKIIFSSGYSADFIKNRKLAREGIELLMKPVQPLELLRKVREILDQ